MKDNTATDYSALDRPEVLMFLFHPRAESGAPFQAPGSRPSPGDSTDIMIPVADDVAIGARLGRLRDDVQLREALDRQDPLIEGAGFERHGLDEGAVEECVAVHQDGSTRL